MFSLNPPKAIIRYNISLLVKGSIVPPPDFHLAAG
jgi:hypothetical protein